MKLNVQSRKVFKTLFTWLLLPSMFAHGSNIIVTLDKDTYSEGDTAKIRVNVRSRPSNSDFEYSITGALVSNGSERELYFYRLNNVFLSSTEKLVGGVDNNNRLKVKLNLQNTKKIKELNVQIKDLKRAVSVLEALPEQTQETVLKISKIRKQIDIFTVELTKQSTLVEEIEKDVIVSAFSCNFYSEDILPIGKESRSKSTREYSINDYKESKSVKIERNGHLYEVDFLVSKKNRRIGPRSKPVSSGEVRDYCTDEYEPELSDDMLPSWAIGRRTPLWSTYDSSARCKVDGQPSPCRARVTLSAGLCDGRHSTPHTGDRPLGRMSGYTQGVFYDIPATELGKPYVYTAPDTAGDINMNWTFIFPDGGTIESQYVLRVYVPSLSDLQDTPFLSNYLTFNNITSHDHGTYGVNGFGLLLLNALQNYVEAAQNDGIPHTPGTNEYYPLNSEGVSLQFGGLFDIGRQWHTPHRMHRQGVDIDIGMSILKAHTHTNDLMGILNRNLLESGFHFDVNSESIRATPAQVRANGFHWHVRYPFGNIVKLEARK